MNKNANHEGKLPSSLQKTFKFSDYKTWAAVRVNGKRVLDVKTMNHDN